MIPPRASWHVRRPTIQPEPPRLDGLLEEDTDAIPVRITVVQDDVNTGWDDGALGFEDDAVWFSGRATSFCLTAPDVLPGAYLLSRREPVTDGEALKQGLPLRHPTRKVWVRVQVLTKDDEAKAEHERRLIAGVKRLRAEPLSPPGERRVRRRDALRRAPGGWGEGSESEYPPLAPRPGLLGPLPKRRTPEASRRLRLAFATSAAGCGVVSFLLDAVHLFPKLASLAGIMTLPLFLNSVAGSGEMTEAERRALERIADEEASSPAP